MKLRVRQAFKVLPFLRGNVSRSGLSWTFHLGRWSWNSRRRTHRLNLPGPVDLESERKP